MSGSERFCRIRLWTKRGRKSSASRPRYRDIVLQKAVKLAQIAGRRNSDVTCLLFSITTRPLQAVVLQHNSCIDKHPNVILSCAYNAIPRSVDFVSNYTGGRVALEHFPYVTYHVAIACERDNASSIGSLSLESTKSTDVVHEASVHRTKATNTECQRREATLHGPK